MIDPQNYQILKQEIAECMAADRVLIDQIRTEIRPVHNEVRRIRPRSTTAVSFVATDGGNNSLQFDPFLVQIVRVVDSNHNELCLEVITPTTNINALSQKQFELDGTPRTALGEMMNYLGIKNLTELSPMISENSDKRPISPSWVQVYRQLVEWAILFHLVRKKDFGSDTLILFDGLLRSKVFARDLFNRYLKGLEEGIEQQRQKNRRRYYLAGIAKKSKVLSRYRLAMALENILTTNYPAYIAIPSEIENNAYRWSEYSRGNAETKEDGEINKFVGGKMFFVKFGSGARDPIWPIDIFEPQLADAPTILGYMLADALNGFPIPLYPQCLQKAHTSAALVDFDFDVLQNDIFEGIRQMLADEAPVLDVFRLQEADPAERRYR